MCSQSPGNTRRRRSTSNVGVSSSIKRNSIHSNAGIGIDLGGAGVTLNDLQDPDVGANNLQNFPLLRNARQSGFQARSVVGGVYIKLLKDPTTWKKYVAKAAPGTG